MTNPGFIYWASAVVFIAEALRFMFAVDFDDLDDDEDEDDEWWENL